MGILASLAGESSGGQVARYRLNLMFFSDCEPTLKD